MAAGTGVLVAARFGLAPLLALIGFVVNPLYATVPFGVLAAELVLTTGGIIAARALWRLLKEEKSRRHVAAVAATAAPRRRRC